MHIRTRDAVVFQIGIAIFLVITFLVIAIPLWRVIMTAVVPLDIYTSSGIPLFLAPWKWSCGSLQTTDRSLPLSASSFEQRHHHRGWHSRQLIAYRTAGIWLVH